VLIGQDVIGQQRVQRGNSGPQAESSVLIGYNAGRGTATVDGGGCQINTCVVIGSQAAQNIGIDGVGNGSLFNSSVIIGYQTYQNGSTAGVGATQNVVCIGAGSGANERDGSGNTYLGAGILSGSLGQQDHVVIGTGAAHNVANNAIGNILIGSRSSMPALLNRNIFIGYGANSTGEVAAPGPLSDNLLIETVDQSSGVRRNLIYGNMGSLTGAVVTSCGIAFGLSSAAHRDLPGMNILKLIDGSKSGAAPVGGGFFYSLAGALHWVGSAGTDTVVAPP
jgi:hypothetical protein